ncbi:FAD-binding oxidoreductase [Actinocorallia aurantiaca]|uniref:FAD-binding oxidoreductase n=1 Tax=Actinocorallia aurantiaca TaxID=46204 RepID=A0ABP6GQF0_9ACTN
MGSPTWDSLGAGLDGDLVLPGDARYDLARQLQLAEFDTVRPAAVAYCATPADVQASVTFAAANALPVAARSGGHHFAGWSTGTGLVIDLSRIAHIEGRPGRVRLGPGAQAVDALVALAADGLEVVTGICPTVCPAGFVTGGGLGLQTRRFGPASDHLLAATLVTADGRLVRCSAEEEPDLYWALRGGGAASFGVVVDLELSPVPIGRTVGFTVVWPYDRALDLLEHWQEWIAAAPPGLGAEIGPVLMDAAPGAVPTVLMFGAYQGTRADFDDLLAGLCAAAGATPLMADIEEGTHEEVTLGLYRCRDLTPAQRRRTGTTPDGLLPRQPYLRERHRFLPGPLGRDALERALEIFDGDRRPGQLRHVALTALGGAAAEVGRTETAYVHRDARFLAKFTAVGLLDEPAEGDIAFAEEWADRGFALLDLFSDHHSYVNYPDPELDDWRWAYYGENYERLAEVKKSLDPHGLFVFPQSIGSGR